MLIDAAPVGARLDWLVLGIGVNLRHAPEIPGRQTTSLAAHNGQADAEMAAQKILERLAFWLGVLASSGTGPVQEAWLERAHPLGTALEIHAASGIMRGAFAGLSAAGELLLARGQNIERINTGEILLGSAAS
jgi:BirA family biotin operon repressor/biotin-[acetyl-CoA-carboxylase] ligase